MLGKYHEESDYRDLIGIRKKKMKCHDVMCHGINAVNRKEMALTHVKGPPHRQGKTAAILSRLKINLPNIYKLYLNAPHCLINTV